MVMTAEKELETVTGNVEVDTRSEYHRELDDIAVALASGHIQDIGEFRKCMVHLSEKWNMMYAHACLELGGRIKLRIDKGYISYEMIRTFDAGVMALLRLDPVS